MTIYIFKEFHIFASFLIVIRYETEKNNYLCTYGFTKKGNHGFEQHSLRPRQSGGNQRFLDRI